MFRTIVMALPIIVSVILIVVALGLKLRESFDDLDRTIQHRCEADLEAHDYDEELP